MTRAQDQASSIQVFNGSRTPRAKPLSASARASLIEAMASALVEEYLSSVAKTAA